MLIASGCVGLPTHVHKTQSFSLANPASTALGRLTAADATAKNLSGFHLLVSGDEALASLIALADHAQRTLDVQYYIIHQDDSTRALLHHVRLAAERGVRVRVLVDDLNTAGEDRRFMLLSQLPNVEVRVFNPFPGGRFALWTRMLVSASDIPRINHRMHNKLFVADNALAITGGRNIGDAYFTRDTNNNFIDLDVVAAGEVVPQLSATFDAFWNSKYAYPIGSLAAAASREAAPKPFVEPDMGPNADWLAKQLDAHRLDLIWVPATVLADGPAKIASETAPNEEVTIAHDIGALISSAQHELIIISPYFVPGKDGLARIRELARKGVRIRILTNSLAATDSPLVNTGYARYRVELLKLGLDLREVRPKLGQRRARFHPFKSSNASLHAKAIVIDQRTVFIGSMNMDARSAKTNSELGLVLRSPDIGRQVIGLLDDLDVDGSYQLSLKDGKHVVWTSGDPGEERHWEVDPETTLVQRLSLKLLAPFAPEELL